jgi:hypothetical protein
MQSGKSIIFYELNEVPRKVLEDFSRSNPRSNIAQLLQRSAFFETVSEDEGHLSPWITWPTLHRGVSNVKHCISDFGQDLADVNREYPSYLEILANAGVKVGLFGSLHTSPLPPNPSRYAFYVPDTFANSPECFPDELTCFQDFNLKMVDMSARNVSKAILAQSAIPLLLNAPRLGLRLKTGSKIVKQLISERINSARTNRRRTTQMQMAFDLFEKQLVTKKPQMATFFTNHVASSMHRYWPAKYPEDYISLKPDNEWIRTYSKEIDFTMAEADEQLGRLMKFVEKNRTYALLIGSSMGQAAVDGQAIVKTQLQIQEISLFMKALGVAEGSWTKRRSMIPQYIVSVSEEAGAKFRDRMQTLTINGNAVELVDLGNNVFQFSIGQVNLDDTSTHIRLDGQKCNLSELGMANVRIDDESGAYAYHIPQGILLVYDPSNPKGQDCGSISTQDIAPSILANFSVPRPAYMRPAFNLAKRHT